MENYFKEKQKGITLIALVITIIVLLILAGVSIATLTGENGILTQASNAKAQNVKSEVEEEVKLAVGALRIEESKKEMTQEEKRKILEDELKKQESDAAVDINGMGFSVKYSKYVIVIDSDYNINEPFDTEEWDNKAAPENVFIWESNDQNDEGYGVVIGYTANADNYTTLRFPSRCTKITFANDLNYEGIDTATSRSFTNNILEVQIPETVNEIGGSAFGGTITGFNSLKKIDIPDSVEKVGVKLF